MKKLSKINIIASTGEDLKEAINDFVCIIEKLKNDINEFKKEVKTLKKQK